LKFFLKAIKKIKVIKKIKTIWEKGALFFGAAPPPPKALV
jgi:hypothetical protein